MIAIPAHEEVKLKKQSQAIELISVGRSITTVCESVEISRTTFYNWLEAYPNFAEQFKLALEKPIDIIEEALFAKAKKGHFGAQVFYLCNRRRQSWQHVARLEVVGNPNQPIRVVPDLSALGADELEAFRALLSKAESAKELPDVKDTTATVVE